MSIKFGTDGWRGIIADDFTFASLEIVARGIAEYLKSAPRKTLPLYRQNNPQASYQAEYRPFEKGVVVGFDRRFQSDNFARKLSEVLARHQIPVYLSTQPVPTPAISWALVKQACCAGIVITASHNPWEWNGVKFKAEYGSSGLPEIMDLIQQEVDLSAGKPAEDDEISPALIEPTDVMRDYLNKLCQLVDLERIKAAHLKIVADPMYGVDAGLLPGLLPGVIEIRNEHNPLFGGVNPEPIEKNVGTLREAVLAHQADLGIAFDGDGDRLGSFDGRGAYMGSHELIPLLLTHLVKNRKWDGGLAVSFSTSQMGQRLAEALSLPVFITPIGFKYLCELMLKENILLAGEESGGIGFKNYLPERDGLLSALLLLEYMAYEQKSLNQLMDDLREKIGSFYSSRIDLKLSNKEQVYQKLKNYPPATISGFRVKEIDRLDGSKFLLEGGSWLLFRLSGTEPLIRIYAEGENPAEVQNLLEAGKEFCLRS